MPQERIEGVEVNMTGDKNWTMDYRPSDLNQVIDDYIAKKHQKPSSWKDLIGFVENHGESEWHITPGEAVAIKEDLSEAKSHGDQFTDDRSKLFQEIHQYRSQNPGTPQKAQQEEHDLHHRGHPVNASGPSGNR
ncbi:MAG: hypothetical protein ACRDFS_04705 [Chloroflexota bacterium]